MIIIDILLSSVTLHNKEIMERKDRYLHKHILNKLQQKHSCHIIFSATGQVALGGVYNYLPPLRTCISSSLKLFLRSDPHHHPWWICSRCYPVCTGLLKFLIDFNHRLVAPRQAVKDLLRSRQSSVLPLCVIWICHPILTLLFLP